MHESERQPPYPGSGTTTKLLLDHMIALHIWTTNQIKILNDVWAKPPLPKLRRCPVEADYVRQPVMDQFRHFVFLRRVQEMYDHIVRTNPGSTWNDESCLRQRVALVQTAIEQLNDCCRPFETREATHARDMERLQGVFANLSSYIEEAVTPQGEGG